MNKENLQNGLHKKWVLLAHRSGAKLLAANHKLNEMNVIKTFSFPDGRKQNHEIDADDRGTRFSTANGPGNATGQKHGLDRHEEAVEHKANVFARELCHELYEGRTHGEFDELILVAEPHFLGRIRTFLDKETSKHVLTSVHHNWIDLDEQTLRHKILEAIREELH